MTNEAQLSVKRHYTPDEVAEIAARDHLTRYPKLAVRRFNLSWKAKNEPRFRFWVLYEQVSLPDTLHCVYQRVRANGGCPGIDHVSFEDIEQAEDSVSFYSTTKK